MTLPTYWYLVLDQYQNMQNCTPQQKMCLDPQKVSHNFPVESAGPETLLSHIHHHLGIFHLFTLAWPQFIGAQWEASHHLTLTCRAIICHCWVRLAYRPDSKSKKHHLALKYVIDQYLLCPQILVKYLQITASIQFKSQCESVACDSLEKKQTRTDPQILAVEKKKVYSLHNKVAMFVGKSKKIIPFCTRSWKIVCVDSFCILMLLHGSWYKRPDAATLLWI